MAAWRIRHRLTKDRSLSPIATPAPTSQTRALMFFHEKFTAEAEAAEKAADSRRKLQAQAKEAARRNASRTERVEKASGGAAGGAAAAAE